MMEGLEWLFTIDKLKQIAAIIITVCVGCLLVFLKSSIGYPKDVVVIKETKQKKKERDIPPITRSQTKGKREG